MVVGSAGGAGAKAHVDWTARHRPRDRPRAGSEFKLAAIYADVSKERVLAALEAGRGRDFEAGYELTPEIVDETEADRRADGARADHRGA